MRAKEGYRLGPSFLKLHLQLSWLAGLPLLHLALPALPAGVLGDQLQLSLTTGRGILASSRNGQTTLAEPGLLIAGYRLRAHSGGRSESTICRKFNEHKRR
ncbi:MAG: hypothetical protein ACE5IE_00375 [Dehalococcoidia bacterium]